MGKRFPVLIAMAVFIVGCSDKQAEMDRQRQEAEVAAQKEAAVKIAAEQAKMKAAAEQAEAEAEAAKKRSATVKRSRAAEGNAQARSAAKDKERGFQETVVDSAKKTGKGVTWLGKKVAGGATSTVNAVKPGDKTEPASR